MSERSIVLIDDIADEIIKVLLDKGFIIHRYDSYTSNSIYLKLDNGVCNSIRISDHEGKKYLKYRYNVIFDYPKDREVIEDKYDRFFYCHTCIDKLIEDILLTKRLKLEKYGEYMYREYMARNLKNHKNDKGFWSKSRLVSS